MNRRRAGDSLIELLMAIGIFSMALLFMLDILAGLEHSIAVDRQYRAAVMMASNKMEEIRLEGLSFSLESSGQERFIPQLPGNPGLPDVNGFYEWSPDPAGRHARVVVEWGAKNQRRQYELETLLPGEQE